MMQMRGNSWNVNKFWTRGGENHIPQLQNGNSSTDYLSLEFTRKDIENKIESYGELTFKKVCLRDGINIM